MLLLNIAIIGIELFVASENTFFYACILEVYRLWARLPSDAFQHLITFEALWSHPGLQVCKWIVGARSDITISGLWRRWSNNSRPKRSSSAQVPAAVCGSALSRRGTTLDVSIPCLFFRMNLLSSFSVLHWTSDVVVVALAVSVAINTSMKLCFDSVNGPRKPYLLD